MHDFNQASAYIAALTGDANSEVWFRCIHDTDKTVPAHKYFGTLAQHWNMLCDYNRQGWGIFANVNAFAPDAKTHNLEDVWYIRAHVADLDNLSTAQASYMQACAATPPPSFAVQSSPGKFHLYWSVQWYQGNARYDALQRRIRQLYNGDPAVIDPTRVLRVPGFYHMKVPATPHMVTCWALDGYGQLPPVEALEAATMHVNVIDGAAGGRHELGDPSLAAPSLEWLSFALSLINPNELSRGDWISTTAAFKQSGWTLTDEQTLFNIWSEWCNQYSGNDAGENHKQWHSIRNTEVGWKSFARRAPTLQAYERFGFKTAVPNSTTHAIAAPPETPPPQSFGEILSEQECAQYFSNCFYVERLGQMLTPKGRFMNTTQFNGSYGGKLFIITPDGKVTDEPWKAATRSTLWTVPKVDHIRFLPMEPPHTIVYDQLGRAGVNTYLPIILRRRQGDVSPFLRHIELLLPVESDRRILLDYLAHNVKYPGFKIPWAPLIQSTEGTGKTFIQDAIAAVLGKMYIHKPSAEELVNSGSTFNAWMRGKLMIIVNEIKIDERRELIEILKPMITDAEIEIQGKGENQEMEDNPANWFFFSNYKNAIPVKSNGRRYSVFYSVIQSKADLLARGMDDAYFNALFHWLRNGGSEIITDWLLNYPIECGAIPMRAPVTSSHDEAIKVSRGPVEIAILNAIEDGMPGFRGGYISLIATINRLRNLGGRLPSALTIEDIIMSMGYHSIGRAKRAYAQESMNEKTNLFAIIPELPVDGFGKSQGYE